ncbi:hypothetical protein KAW96_10630 [candidate division WOR-3 bacterium]|nr:hypothetical protein [candidate division WOR-3 bacterium]
MKKTVPLFIILLITIPFSLDATETRISALGSEENLLIDDSNIYSFPSCLERFVERGIVEYGLYPYADSIAYFSFLKELGRLGNIGLVFNKKGIPLFPSTSYQTLIAQPYLLINLYYSRRITGTLSIGVSGGYGVAASNVDEPGTANDITNESSVSSGKISLGYFIGEEEHFLELSAGAHSYEFTYELGGNFTFNNDNKISTDFSGRFFYYLNDYLSLIPFFTYSTLDLSSKEIAGSITTEIKRITTTKRAGVGINLMPFQENRIIIGVLYNTKVFEKTSVDYDTTVMDNNIPVIVCGIESELKSWFIVRAGIRKSLLIRKVESSDGINSVMTEKDTPFKLNVGFGIRFGSLEVDAIINEDLPFTYGYFISGKENPVFTKVSATYLF